MQTKHWENVKLASTSKPGIYTVTFNQCKKNRFLPGRPVLEEGDYDAAMKVFREKEKCLPTCLKKT
jgi:hypothetical protein